MNFFITEKSIYSTKFHQYLLALFLKTIDALNTADKKTRYFVFKYYQSFNIWLSFSYDNILIKVISLINQAILDNNADSILSILVSDLQIKPGVITKQDIELFLENAKKM